MTRMQVTQWLLANGEVITEPALEMTASGRKVRVAGTTDSVYYGELHGLLTRAAETVAAQRGTTVWMELPYDVPKLVRTVAGIPDTQVKLHLVHDPTNAYAKTVTWWRFKDANSPFEVLLVATMWPRRGDLTSQEVDISLAVPIRRYGYSEEMEVCTTRTATFSELNDNSMSRTDHYYVWQEFLRDHEPDWPSNLLEHKTHSYARPAVTQYLKALQAFEELESIQVPDFSNPEKPGYMTLDLYDTNVNAELLSDLAEYLDGAPTIEQAAQLYQQMLDTLRSVGISVGKKSENDFMAAMLAGDSEVLNMQVQRLAEQGMSLDRHHRLSTHLPSGTFIVECDHAMTDRNQVAEKWEEAVTMASLTGQEDDLLAYAKAYAADRIKQRTKTILKERAETV